MKITTFLLLLALAFIASINPGVALAHTTPSVEIWGEPALVNSTSAFVVTAEFSEVVSGFVDSEVSVSNAEVTSFSSADSFTYSLEITPSGVGNISIDIAAGVAENLQFIGNTAAQQVQIAFDATAPTVAISDEPATVSTLAPFDIRVEFSEPVNDVIDTDITLGNAVITRFTPLEDGSYSVQITPDGGGDISIDIAADVTQDAALNGNLAATRALIDFDTIAPIADAGLDQVVREGEMVIILDGSGSTDEPPGYGCRL